MVKAPQIPTMNPAATKNAAISFDGELEAGESLTGTPTVTATPDGLTIDNKRVSTGELEINDQAVAAGRAVQFRVSGDPGTYEIRAVCGTTSSPAQTLVVDCVLTVLDT